MFFKSELLVLNKTDLLEYVPFDMNAAKENARKVHPEIEIIEVSSLTRDGMTEWFEWLNQESVTLF